MPLRAQLGAVSNLKVSARPSQRAAGATAAELFQEALLAPVEVPSPSLAHRGRSVPGARRSVCGREPTPAAVAAMMTGSHPGLGACALRLPPQRRPGRDALGVRGRGGKLPLVVGAPSGVLGMPAVPSRARIAGRAAAAALPTPAAWFMRGMRPLGSASRRAPPVAGRASGTPS